MAPCGPVAPWGPVAPCGPGRSLGPDGSPRTSWPLCSGLTLRARVTRRAGDTRSALRPGRPNGTRLTDFPVAIGAHDANRRLASLAVALTDETDETLARLLLLDADVDRGESASVCGIGKHREDCERRADEERGG